MTYNPHPFKPGTAVLALSETPGKWQKDIVEKLYATGRFTLRNEGPARFKAYQNRVSDRFCHWAAIPANSKDYKTYTVLLWTKEVEAEINDPQVRVATSLRRHNADFLQRKLCQINTWNITEAQFGQLEALVTEFMTIPRPAR